MRKVTKVVCSGLLFIAQILSVTAQNQADKKRLDSGAKTQRNAKNDELTPDQQLALFLLDDLLRHVETLDDAQLKFRAQAQVADILWGYDEPRSRRLFEQTFRNIVSAEPDNQIAVSSASIIASASPLSQIQRDVLSLIARRDAILAEKLIDSIPEAKLNKEGASKAQGDISQAERSELYLQAASSVAETNPERAAKLAESSFISGLNPSILNVLFTLRQKNPAQADALYRVALAKVRGDIRHASVNIQILASYALPQFATVGMSGSSDLVQNSGAVTKHDSAMAIEFLNFVYDTFQRLSNPEQVEPANPVDYMTGQRLLPFFVRSSPERAPMFRNMLDMMAHRTSQSAALDMVNKMFQPINTDDLLKQAEQMKDQFQRDLLYFRAVITLAAKGDFDRALSLTENINDRDFRSSLASLVCFQAASTFLKKGDIDSSLRYAKDIPEVRQRALMLAKVALTLFNKQEPVRASEVLADAEQIIRNADEGEQKAQALLMMAEIEARIDPRRGFEVMETTVKAFNDADLKAEDKTQAVPNAGFSLSSMLTKIFSPETPNLAPSFSLLARSDFNRALRLSHTLKKKDRSVLAQLAVFRSILAPKHEKQT